MPSSTIKFDVPDGCRAFTLFPRLPAELRHRIWESYLGSEQGANFAKFQASDDDEEWALRPNRAATNRDAEELDDVGRVLKHHDDVPRETITCLLTSPYPVPMADASHHARLRRRLAIMAATCSESRSLARSLVARPGVLRLDSDTVVSLDGNLDLLVLDYYPHELYKKDDTLDVDFVCPSLSIVRRLAVSFCHSWRPETTLERSCSCGKHRVIDAGNYPTHLYQFLARNLPSLREFYFVDYFIVPRMAEEMGGAMCINDAAARPCTSHVFRARDRLFHDVGDCDPSTGPWKMDPKSGKILDWLRDRFVRYASQSQTSRHKSPEQVYFGLLACEWKVSPPFLKEDQPRFRIPRSLTNGRGRGPPPGRYSGGRIPVIRRPTVYTPHPLSRRSMAAATETVTSGGAERPDTQAAQSLSPSVFVFGSGCGDGYKFTFSQPFS